MLLSLAFSAAATALTVTSEIALSSAVPDSNPIGTAAMAELIAFCVASRAVFTADDAVAWTLLIAPSTRSDAEEVVVVAIGASFELSSEQPAAPSRAMAATAIPVTMVLRMMDSPYTSVCPEGATRRGTRIAPPAPGDGGIQAAPRLPHRGIRPDGCESGHGLLTWSEPGNSSRVSFRLNLRIAISFQ